MDTPESHGWFYARGTEKVGPVRGPLLEDAIKAGLILPETLVWCSEMTDWLPAEKTGLSSLVFGSPPPIPGSEVPPLLQIKQEAGPMNQSPSQKTGAGFPGTKWPNLKVRVRRWRIRRTIAAVLMLMGSWTFHTALMYKAAWPPLGLRATVSILWIGALVAGYITFDAVRKLQVVDQFQRTGVNDLRKKVVWKTRRTAALYFALLVVLVWGSKGSGGIEGEKIGEGIGTGILTILFSYALSVYSTRSAIKMCQNLML